MAVMVGRNILSVKYFGLDILLQYVSVSGISTTILVNLCRLVQASLGIGHLNCLCHLTASYWLPLVFHNFFHPDKNSKQRYSTAEVIAIELVPCGTK